MKDQCTCKPGSYENGWHEKRCAFCLAEERKVWSEMMKHFNHWLHNGGLDNLR